VTTTAQQGYPAINVDYTIYVPSTYDPAAATPVMIAANVGLTPWRNLAEAEGFIAVDFRDHDQNGAWNFNYDVLLFNAILADVQGAWNADTKRIYFHGFSAGAHWGLTVILANANAFAGLGISAGSLGVAINAGVWPGQVQRQIPVAIRQGTQDTVVPPAAGQQTRDLLVGAGHPVDYGEFNGGHTVSAADAQAIWDYLKQFQAP
jgi:predicted esterase